MLKTLILINSTSVGDLDSTLSCIYLSSIKKTGKLK